MCLAKPRKVVATGPGPVAEIDHDGTFRRVSLAFLGDVAPGDFVIVQAGHALRRLGAAEAAHTLALFETLEDLRRLDPDQGAAEHLRVKA